MKYIQNKNYLWVAIAFFIINLTSHRSAFLVLAIVFFILSLRKS